MKYLLNYFLFAIMLLGLSACEKEDKDMFIVEGERNFSVTKEGDMISVIMRTTQDYRVTPENNWCIVLAKQPIGFKIQVNENTTVRERENKITIESNIGAPVVLTVRQEAGELFFRMDDSEKAKQFAQEGGTQTVALQTNLEDYEVIPLGWCTISEKTNEGFKITAEANSDFRREGILLVRAQGMDDIEILVKQNGEPLLKNPYFLDGNFEPWVIERSIETVFVAGTWIPGSITNPEKNRYRAIKIDTGGASQGSIFQTVNGIPDGTYTLTFIAYAGGSSTDGSNLWLVIIDNEGNETVESIFAEARGGWKTITRQLTVTGGKVSIGLRATRGSDKGIWFHALGLELE